jgi:outer membrane protein TolC
MRRIFLSLITLSLLSTTTLQAQEPVTLTLDQAIAYALKNSVAARNARIDVKLQEAKNREVAGLALPQISADGKYTQFFDVQQAFLPSQFAGLPPGDWVPLAFSPKLSSVGQVNASQVLFNGSVLVALQARKTLLEMARLSNGMNEENIRFNVTKMYHNIQVMHKRLEVTVKSLQLIRKSAREAEIIYKNGFTEKIDVDRLQVLLGNSESDSINLAGGIDMVEKMFKANLGMPVNTPIVLSEIPSENEIEGISELLSTAQEYENKLSYQAAATAVALQEYDLRRYRFEGLPSLVAFGGAGYNRSSSKFSDLVNKPYPGFSFVGLQLSIPIFDGMQRHNRVTAAKLNLEKAKNNLENAKLIIDMSVSSARSGFANALSRLNSLRKNMELAASVVDQADRKLKAGVGSNQELVNAQQDWLTAQNGYFLALQNAFDQQTELQNALGLLK